MTVRRHLLDLYQTGRELTLTEGLTPVLDENDEPVLDEHDEPVVEPAFADTVWIAKLSKLDHKAALRHADAAKAVVLIAHRDHSSDEWAAGFNTVMELTGGESELLREFIITSRLAEREESVGAEIVGEEVADGEPSEWKKDNYLQGLMDAWRGAGLEEGADSMQRRFALNPDDLEAKRVFDEMNRYIELVDERLAEERVEIEAEIGELDRDQLVDKVVELHLESRANEVWWEEYNASRVWLSLRKADKHNDYYLTGGREDVGRLHPDVYTQVLVAVELMRVDDVEGKDSPATRASSA